MYNTGKAFSAHKPTKIANIPGSKTKTIILKPSDSIAKSPSSSDQLKKAAKHARDSLETAIASMNAVWALETRENVPPQYMQEYQRRITCLGDGIRVQWNSAIFDY